MSIKKSHPGLRVEEDAHHLSPATHYLSPSSTSLETRADDGRRFGGLSTGVAAKSLTFSETCFCLSPHQNSHLLVEHKMSHPRLTFFLTFCTLSLTSGWLTA